MVVKEREVGDEFLIKDNLYRVELAKGNTLCDGCAFIDCECYKNLQLLDMIGCCTEDMRTDKENVIFKEVKNG